MDMASTMKLSNLLGQAVSVVVCIAKQANLSLWLPPVWLMCMRVTCLLLAFSSLRLAPWPLLLVKTNAFELQSKTWPTGTMGL